ncbi:hypothetical protein QP166_13945 [Sphingomonas sp. LR60]|uniref:hypothetical protein n=1 Tax=Sphingomonas sp. LR60 TaxID=3050233 RepID=UPI002FE2C6D3
MKKIVAGMSAVALALSLAACGSKTDTANDSAINADLGNDAALNETLPGDENLSDVGALPLNATDGNVATATTNAF